MSIGKTLLRWMALWSLVFWIGGFTFYGGVVIPVLHDQLGSALEAGLGHGSKTPICRVTLGLSARTLIGPALGGLTRGLGCRAGASGLREPRVPQEFQPVSMGLTCQQLRGTLPDSTGVFTPQVSAVVQEELEQRQVVVPQLPS